MNPASVVTPWPYTGSPRSRHDASHSSCPRCTSGIRSKACTAFMITGRPLISASRSMKPWPSSPSGLPLVIWMNPSLRSARTSANWKHVSECMTSVTIGVPSKSRWMLAPLSGWSRCADQPPAPASIASCSRRRISACSASVGITPALARSHPSTHTSSGPTGTNGRRLTESGCDATRSRNSGYVTQFHGSPAFIESYGIASTRVIDRIDRSRSSGRPGAKPKPQLPMTTDVTPCQPDNVQYGIPEELRVVVRVEVDEPGRDDQAVGVEDALGVGGVDLPEAGRCARRRCRRRSGGAASPCRRRPCRCG